MDLSKSHLALPAVGWGSFFYEAFRVDRKYAHHVG
jgi:hypothetical protein